MYPAGSVVCCLIDGRLCKATISSDVLDADSTAVVVDVVGESRTVPVTAIRELEPGRAIPFTQPPRESTNGDNPN